MTRSNLANRESHVLFFALGHFVTLFPALITKAYTFCANALVHGRSDGAIDYRCLFRGQDSQCAVSVVPWERAGARYCNRPAATNYPQDSVPYEHKLFESIRWRSEEVYKRLASTHPYITH